MATIVKLKAEYEGLIKNASKLYLSQQYHKAWEIYNDAFTLGSQLNLSKMVLCVLKYMICCCLYKSNEFENLAEAVMIMQTLDKSLKNRFPAVYFLLAQTHCKLYRFDQALHVIDECEELFKHNPLLETFYIPGTEIEIQPNKRDENWLKIKEECLTWHQPDAVCNLTECNNYTKPYVTPNRNIFLKDPAFSGMVIVSCNNKERQCSLKFHQCCWKFKKDQMYPVEKVSDKDILGNTCFTPNCMNGNVICVISEIEVIDQHGELKAHIKGATSVTWPVNKNGSKGAIKKVKLNTPKKAENINTTPSKQLSFASIKQETNRKKMNRYGDYDGDQIMKVIGEMKDIDFSHEPVTIAGEKSFIFSLFYDYIQNDIVRICDLYSKFAEISENISSKDLDILSFLLSTNKFEVLEDKTLPYYQIPKENLATDEHNRNKFNPDNTQDIDDVYYELTNDDDYFNHVKNQTLKNNNNQGSMVNPNSCKSNPVNTCNANINNEAAGGDAPSNLQNNIDEKLLLQFPNSSHNFTKDTRSSNDSEKRGTENRKLKEYINQLENEMKQLLEEISAMKTDLKNKNAEIEFLKKQEQENTTQMVNKYDELYKSVNDFRKKYETIKDDNIKLKQEILDLMNEKTALKEELSKSSDPTFAKKKLMKSFQEEYQILQDCIKSEWEEKTKKLEELLQAEVDIRISLLDKCLNYQFTGNKNLIQGYLDNCALSLDIVTKINEWMEKALGIRQFADNSQWVSRLNLLQKASANIQVEYSRLLQELHSDDPEEFKMTECNISLPVLPQLPRENVSDILQNALETFYNKQVQIIQIIQGLSKAPPQQQRPPHIPPYQIAMHYPHQYTQQYQFPAAYPRMPSPLIGNSILGSPILNYPVPRTTGLASPMIPIPLSQQEQQQTYRNTATISEIFAQVCSKETNLQKEDLVSSNNNATPLTVKLESDLEPIETEINKPNIKEERNVQEAETEDDNPNGNTDDNVENFHERITRMRKAFKDIALNIREKTTANNADSHSENERIEASIKYRTDDDFERESDHKDHAKKNSLSLKSTTASNPWDLNVQEKTTANNADSHSENERIEASIKYQTDDDFERDSDHKDHAQNNSLPLKSTTASNPWDNSAKKAISTSKKKVGTDALIKIMLKKYPGLLETELLEVVENVRKMNNNTLSGIPLKQIFKESEEFIVQNQRLHCLLYTQHLVVNTDVLRYIPNNGDKSTGSETPTKKTQGSSQQIVQKEVISPASSCSSLTKVDISSPNKKTWNVLPPETVRKWTGSVEAECSICMNPIKKNSCYTLNCGHSFHSLCIKLWLKTDRSCPNCRVAITDDDDFPPLLA